MPGARTRETYSVVRGDPRDDKADVLRLCSRNLPGFTDGRYTKYFERNPLGPATFFLARSGTADAVGTAALHPTELLVGGRVRRAAIAGDFAVDPEHRGFGPALALQRALLKVVREQGLDIVYGLPNRAAAGVFRHLGYREVGAFVKFVKPLRPWPALKALSDATGRRDRLRAVVPGLWRRGSLDLLETFSVEAPLDFDERFVPLWSHASDRWRVLPRRTPELLNWKYEKGDRETDRFGILALARDGTIAAYAVTYAGYDAMHLADVAWTDAASLEALVAAVIRDGHRRRSAAIDVLYLGPTAELSRTLRAQGFFTVPAPALMLHTSTPSGDDLLDRESWFLFEGALDL